MNTKLSVLSNSQAFYMFGPALFNNIKKYFEKIIYYQIKQKKIDYS